MNSVLVTIAPAMDAFTSMYCPARRAASAMTSSVRLPSVALSRPPTASPVLAATDSVAWLSSAASGTMASTDSTKSSVCASGLSLCGDEHDRHEGQQPEQRVVPDFLEQWLHRFISVGRRIVPVSPRGSASGGGRRLEWRHAMTWLQRYRLQSFVRSSVWLPSLVGLLAALAANRLMLTVDRLLDWPSRVGVEGARILLTALASSMLTFIVFVFSILLLAVQLASAQLTPRVIATFYRNRVLRLSLSLFVFVFTFDLAVVVRIDDVRSAAVRLAGRLRQRGLHRRLPLHDRQGRQVAPARHRS